MTDRRAAADPEDPHAAQREIDRWRREVLRAPTKAEAERLARLLAIAWGFTGVVVQVQSSCRDRPPATPGDWPYTVMHLVYLIGFGEFGVYHRIAVSFGWIDGCGLHIPDNPITAIAAAR